MSIQPGKLRDDFPVFREHPELVYLDSAATSQKPEKVIERVQSFYREENANAGRGLYELAAEATESFSEAREVIADFTGVSSQEIVFTSGCTEGINLLASSLELEGEILVPEMSHHSEQLPWRKNFGEDRVKFIPTTESYTIDLDAAEKMIGQETSLVSISHVSNVFGGVAPVERIVEMAHENDALVVLDAAQSVPHMPVDFGSLGVDFAVFSGHKMLGPTGTGALYGRKKLLDSMSPYRVGGGMVKSVKRNEVDYVDPPQRFEAGTQNIAGAVGLAAAVEYLQDAGMENVADHGRHLGRRIVQGLEKVEGVEVMAAENPLLVSFSADWAHPHDIAEVLSEHNVAVRAGHHCAQPQMESLQRTGTVRASPYLYNTVDDVGKLVEAVEEARRVFR